MKETCPAGQRNSSIDEWKSEADKRGVETLLSRGTLNDRLKAWYSLEEYELPRYNYVETTVMEFLQKPREIFSLVKERSDMFYPKIIKPDGQRRFKLGLDESKTIQFVRDASNGKLKRPYRLPNGELYNKDDKFIAEPEDKLVLSEYCKNLYGGNLIIHEDGYIKIELGRGEHSNLNYAHTVPIVSGAKNIYTGLMTWERLEKETEKGERPAGDKEFDELLPALQKTIACIPDRYFDKPTSYVRRSFSEYGKQPGYYEFALIKRKTDPGKELAELEPLFIDCQPVDQYKITHEEALGAFTPYDERNFSEEELEQAALDKEAEQAKWRAQYETRLDTLGFSPQLIWQKCLEAAQESGDPKEDFGHRYNEMMLNVLRDPSTEFAQQFKVTQQNKDQAQETQG